MTLGIHLLGRPTVRGTDGPLYAFRSRKSWALLTYLLLSERPATRSQLATLLFAEAEDPLRALRWSLSEIRRILADGGSIDGDPVILKLPAGAVVDVDVVMHGSWEAAVALPGIGTELLQGLSVRGAAGFESWLLSMQRHVAASSEEILHEAALATLSRGDFPSAIRYAVRAAEMSPFDENHHALLIRLYRLSGEDEAARAQFTTCTEMLRREFGATPSLVVHEAMRETRHRGADATTDLAAVEAIVEAGSAAVAAGAVEAGVRSLRTAVHLADGAHAPPLRVRARLVLAEALVHSVGGLDEEGLATLHEADQIALADDDHESVARARSEIGYVDFLRARYDRAELWLNDALRVAHGSPGMVAKAQTYLGSIASDCADYGRATELLADARLHARAARDARREAFALSMAGRIGLLRGDLDAAEAHLADSIELAERDHWLAFLPWPQALLGEVRMTAGDPHEATVMLQQAFARACQLGDPCWEGMAARGLALVAEANGDTTRSFDVLADARRRCRRHADPYVWLDAYILDAQCELGRRHAHPDVAKWVDTMGELASRTGMRELTVRSLLHSAAIGRSNDAAAAALLAADVDNPRLASMLPAPIDRGRD